LVAAIVLGALVLADILIADYGLELPLYHQLQREHEEHGPHTATLALMGSIIAFKLFALPAALAAVGMLIYGDAAAAIAGISSGSGRKKRAMPRVLAMFIVSAIIGWLVFGSWIGIAMAVVATLAECMVTIMDDAISIPLFAGLAGHIMLLYLL
jgi:dolichol kinase